jgi:hypothetical protein
MIFVVRASHFPEFSFPRRHSCSTLPGRAAAGPAVRIGRQGLPVMVLLLSLGSVLSLLGLRVLAQVVSVDGDTSFIASRLLRILLRPRAIRWSRSRILLTTLVTSPLGSGTPLFDRVLRPRLLMPGTPWLSLEARKALVGFLTSWWKADGLGQGPSGLDPQRAPGALPRSPSGLSRAGEKALLRVPSAWTAMLLPGSESRCCGPLVWFSLLVIFTGIVVRLLSRRLEQWWCVAFRM